MKEKLTERVIIRCTPEFKAAVEAEAKRRMIRVSDFVRYVISEECVKEKERDEG